MSKHRVTLTLGSKTYKLVPSAGLALEISRKVADPMRLTLAMQTASMTGQTPPLTQVVGVLHLALQDIGEDLTFEDVWEAIYKAGFSTAYTPFSEVIACICNAGEMPEPEFAEGADQVNGAKPRNRKERRQAKKMGNVPPPDPA